MLPDLSGKVIALVAMGGSCWEYMYAAVGLGNPNNLADETWGINTIGSVIRCDRVFCMDTPKALLYGKGNTGEQWRWLESANCPVYTAIADPDFPKTIDYPLEEVLNKVKHPYLNTTPAYAMAFAIACKVKEIYLFGIDFSNPGDPQSEPGRGCFEFWIGVAVTKGIRVQIANTSTLMDMNVHPHKKFYGYEEAGVAVLPQFENGKITVKRNTL